MVQGLAGLRNRSTIFVAALVLAVVLSGCDTEKTRNLIDQRAGEAQQSLTQAREQQPAAKRYNPLVVTDKIWEGNAAMRMHRGLPLPARYETPRGITIISGQPLPLVDIADAITSQTGIPVRVADAGASARGRSSVGSASSPASPPGAPGFSFPGASPSSFGAGASSSASQRISANNSASNDGMLVSYEGPLSGLMERVAGFFGVNWRYDGTSIVIARFETRVFLIEALPETATVTDSSQGSSSSSSSGGSSSGSSGGSSGGSGSTTAATGSTTGAATQNTSYTGNVKYWEELKETLTAMLGGVGVAVITPTNGEVTVTTTPELHANGIYLFGAGEQKAVAPDRHQYPDLRRRSCPRF